MDHRAFEPSLAALKQWREEMASALTELRRWAIVHRLTEDQTAARMAHLERRLASDRLSIAFVAEISRGKSELINALFFADLGARLLPAGEGRTTVCPTEILHDPTRAPSIRLLPIETRESPRALREFIAEASGWKEIALDPARPEGFADAFDALSETLSVSEKEAHNLGLQGEAGAHVEIPRWRYAIVNFPHPLLAMGLTILDTPGLAALGTEPELTMHRLQEADAVVFVLSADTGTTGADLDLWHEHVEPMEGLGHTRYVVLNKIDRLRDGVQDRNAGPFGDRPAGARYRRDAGRRPDPGLPAFGATGPRGAHRGRRRRAREEPALPPRAGTGARARARAPGGPRDLGPRRGALAPRRDARPPREPSRLRRGTGGRVRATAGQEPEARGIPGARGGGGAASHRGGAHRAHRAACRAQPPRRRARAAPRSELGARGGHSRSRGGHRHPLQRRNRRGGRRLLPARFAGGSRAPWR